MSELKILRCQSCNEPLKQKDEYRINHYECSACGCINVLDTPIPVRESKEERKERLEREEYNRKFKEWMSWMERVAEEGTQK